jgi:hypothetical protein
VRVLVRNRPQRVGGRKLIIAVARWHMDIRWATRLDYADRLHPRGVHGHMTRDGWVFFIDWQPLHFRVQWHDQRSNGRWHERPGRYSRHEAGGA